MLSAIIQIYISHIVLLLCQDYFRGIIVAIKLGQKFQQRLTLRIAASLGNQLFFLAIDFHLRICQRPGVGQASKHHLTAAANRVQCSNYAYIA